MELSVEKFTFRLVGDGGKGFWDLQQSLDKNAWQDLVFLDHKNGKGTFMFLLLRAQQFFVQTTLAFAGACSGVVLYEALFPGFYYMTWLIYLPVLWGLVALAYISQTLALLAIARWKQVTLPSSTQKRPSYDSGAAGLATHR